VLLFVDSASHYNTAQIAQKWSAATSVTVDPTAGRLGTGALAFDASTSSRLQLSGVFESLVLAGAETLIVGLAVKPLTLGANATIPGLNEAIAFGLSLDAAEAGLTLLRFTTTFSTFYVNLTPLGALRVFNVPLTSASLHPVEMVAFQVGQSGNGAVTLGRGNYIEAQVVLSGHSHGVDDVVLRVNGAVVLSARDLSAAPAGTTWASLSIGGPNTQLDAVYFNTEVGTFLTTDYYLLDGVSTPSLVPDPTNTNPEIVVYLAFDTFLGNVKVEACFPVADSLVPAELQWTPSAGVHHYPLIDSPIADDTTNVASATPDDIDLYRYVATTLTAGLDPVTLGDNDPFLALALYAMQWCWRSNSQTNVGQAVVPVGFIPRVRPQDVITGGPAQSTDVAVPTYLRVLTSQTLLNKNGVAYLDQPLTVFDVRPVTQSTNNVSLFGSGIA
jgi:hypothetical protein